MCGVSGVSSGKRNFDHLILDFRNFVYRSLHSTNSASIERCAAQVIERMVVLCERYNVEYENFHICLEGSKNWRYEIYPEYKGNRNYSSDLDSSVYDVIPLLEHIIKYTKFSVWNGNKCEGDDIFGTLSRELCADGSSVAIYSSDRDLLQLSTDLVWNIVPMAGEGEVVIDSNLHFERYGYTPNQRILIKALAGDSGDNIPGVYGIGQSFATKLAINLGSFDKAKEVFTQTPARLDGETGVDYKKRLKETNELFTPKKFEAIKRDIKNFYISYIIGAIVLNVEIYKLDNLNLDAFSDLIDAINSKCKVEVKKSLLYLLPRDLFNITGD